MHWDFVVFTFSDNNKTYKIKRYKSETKNHQEPKRKMHFKCQTKVSKVSIALKFY